MTKVILIRISTFQWHNSENFIKVSNKITILAQASVSDLWHLNTDPDPEPTLDPVLFGSGFKDVKK